MTQMIDVPKVTRRKIFGPKLAQWRHKQDLSQQALAEKVGIARETIARYESADVSPIGPGAATKLAGALGMTLEEFEKKIGAPADAKVEEMTTVRLPRDVVDSLRGTAKKEGMKFEVLLRTFSEKANAKEASSKPAKQGSKDDGKNIEISRTFIHPLPPVFEVAIAAGGWTDIEDQARAFNPRDAEQGEFNARLLGDSMSPTYPSGTVVVFRFIHTAGRDLQIGADYYVQKADGEATFKKLKSLTRETMEFSAINKTKYPRTLLADRHEVVKMARAIAVVTYLDGSPPMERRVAE